MRDYLLREDVPWPARKLLDAMRASGVYALLGEPKRLRTRAGIVWWVRTQRHGMMHTEAVVLARE
jgi:hypothetical protein